MHILVNDQQIAIISKSVKRFNSDGHLLLTVFITKTEKTGNELDELCDYINANAPDIFVCDNSGAKEETLTGFRLKARFGRNEDGTAWKLEIENSSELEYQYGRLLDRAEALETLAKEQAETIQTQTAFIENLNQQLLVVQMAAADLYEKNMAAESLEENIDESEPVEEPAEPETEPEVEQEVQ